MAHVGIFDSGFGGHYVAAWLRRFRPDDEYVVVDDAKNLPYGSRSSQEIIDLTDAAMQPLLTCDVIIIACNTATTYAIAALRQKYLSIPFVGFEPMIKTVATATKTGSVAILATPATLKSSRYQALKRRWASHCVMHMSQTVPPGLCKLNKVVLKPRLHWNWRKN